MHTVDYSQWYYLIYLLPGGAALLTLLLSFLGGGHHHSLRAHAAHPGHGLRLAGHHGAHLHASPHAAAHHPAISRAGAGHHGARTAVHPPTASPAADARTRDLVQQATSPSFLLWFGFGRVPPPFIWGSLLLGWGIFGFWATRILSAALPSPVLFALPAAAVAAMGAMAMARVLSLGFARFAPTEDSLAVGSAELIGLVGTAAFAIDGERGRIHVYDDYGTMHDCTARLTSGKLPIARGKKAMVVDYDPAKDQLIVEEAPAEWDS